MNAHLMRVIPCALLVLLAGCVESAPTTEPTGRARHAAVTPGEAPTSPEVDPRWTPEQENALKQDGVAPRRVISTVDWDAAARHAQWTAPTSLDAELAQTLATSPVPLLVAPEQAAIDALQVVHGEHWAAASTAWAGHTVHIMGNRQAFEDEALADAIGRPQQGSAQLTRTHGIVTASFQAFGVAYTLNVECEAPMDDARCTEDAYTADLVERLVVAGGTR